MKRTEVTIEVDRTVTIRQVRRDIRAKCAECGGTVDMLSLEEAVEAAQVNLRTRDGLIDAKEINCYEPPVGVVLKCPVSLNLLLADHLSSDYRHQSAELGEHEADESVRSKEAQHSILRIEDQEITEYVTRSVALSQSRPAQSNVSGLTKEALEGLLAYLDPDWERSGQKYELIRRKLVKFFECRGCVSPEEYADTTIDKVAAKIANGAEIQANNPYGFFYGVAKNILKEYWRHSKKQPLSFDEIDQAEYGLPDLPEDELEQQRIERRFKYLDLCLQELPQDSRDLITRYYWGRGGESIKNRKLMSERLAIPLNALRIRVHRIRAKLERRINQLLCEKYNEINS